MRRTAYRQKGGWLQARAGRRARRRWVGRGYSAKREQQQISYTAYTATRHAWQARQRGPGREEEDTTPRRHREPKTRPKRLTAHAAKKFLPQSKERGSHSSIKGVRVGMRVHAVGWRHARSIHAGAIARRPAGRGSAGRGEGSRSFGGFPCKCRHPRTKQTAAGGRAMAGHNRSAIQKPGLPLRQGGGAPEAQKSGVCGSRRAPHYLDAT